MILKQGDKYIIKSEDGSKILGTYSTKEEAEKRLHEIEYFKNKGKKKNESTI